MQNNIKDVEIRPATSEDFRLFSHDGAPRTCYAWVASYKGVPTCLAGVTVEARRGCMAYSEILPGCTAPKRTIWRTAVALMEHMRALQLPMNAACEPLDLAAQKFVAKLGFKWERNFQGMELFICRG